MMREYVRDRAGRTLGYYEDNGVSDRVEGRDAAGRLLGVYHKRQNETRDAAGHFIATGNVLPSLVFRP